MLRKTTCKAHPHQRTTPKRTQTALKLRLSVQASLIALSALLMSACSTPQGGSSHNIPSAHSNDIWQRIRDKFAMPELENAEVGARENYYATRADYVGRMATRSGDFLYLIMDEVERRRMPSELALLPFVESAFVTSAKSSAAASGLWQFMPATGRDFSLQQNRFADQRNDVIASTNAALDYLQRLYNMYGDWHLALAAYNWGQGNVSRAVSRSLSAGGSGKYTDINMPAETRQYVPKLQAIKNIVRNPGMYGISLPNIPNRLRHEAILVTRDIDVSTAAELANMSEEEFKRINPAYKKPVIVAALNSRILVPADRADDFRRAFSDKSRQLASLTTYTTYSTEALADIASKYNTDENRLRELNGIPYNHSYVRADSTLIVPRTRKNDEISYLALNSSVRSITGGVGITDYNPYNNDTTSPTLIASSGKSSTGLVADTNDADQLSTLISAAPSTPAYVPTVAPTITPIVTTIETTTANASAPSPYIDPTPSRIVDKPKADILTMPPVAKAQPVVDTASDPIAQLTQTNNITSNVTEIADDTSKATDLTANATPSVETKLDTDVKAVAPKLTADSTPVYSTDSIIIPETDTNALSTPSVTTASPSKGLSTTEKVVLAAAVASVMTTPKEPAKTITKTNYRVPQANAAQSTAPSTTLSKQKAAPASVKQKTAVTTKPAPTAKAAQESKLTQASKADKNAASKISGKNAAKATAPSKPEPKKPENKAVANAPRVVNNGKTKPATTQQTPQKSGTAGKIAGKAEAKPTAKPVIKPIVKPTAKPEVKSVAKPTTKAPVKTEAKTAKTTSSKSSGSSSSSVILPKKK